MLIRVDISMERYDPSIIWTRAQAGLPLTKLKTTEAYMARLDSNVGPSDKARQTSNESEVSFICHPWLTLAQLRHRSASMAQCPIKMAVITMKPTMAR